MREEQSNHRLPQPETAELQKSPSHNETCTEYENVRMFRTASRFVQASARGMMRPWAWSLPSICCPPSKEQLMSATLEIESRVVRVLVESLNVDENEIVPAAKLQADL